MRLTRALAFLPLVFATDFTAAPMHGPAGLAVSISEGLLKTSKEAVIFYLQTVLSQVTFPNFDVELLGTLHISDIKFKTIDIKQD